MGVRNPAEHKSRIKNLLRRELDVDFEICPLTFKLGVQGFLGIGNTNITIKNCYDDLLRVYASTFPKIRKLSPNLEIGFVVFRRQKHIYNFTKFVLARSVSGIILSPSKSSKNGK